MNSASVVSKVWSFCTTLRDDGGGYGDYLEQLTYLIFLKMADEYARPPYGRDVGIPEDYGWTSLTARRGAELESHYVALLRGLGQQQDMLGQIFTKAQNKITDPAKLFRLIDMVDGTDWVMLGADVKGDIYEGLLERNAEDTKSGAEQYFTPRALIRAMVACVRPEPGKTIADPACGTGGFFLAAHDFLSDPQNWALDRDQKAFLKHATFHGNEIVAGTRRLCLMNMLLHGIGEMTGETAVSPADALISPPSETFDYVLFEGAGETIRRKLLQTTDLHTILRLPTGIFYAQGVKANVIFFDNRPASPDPQSLQVWYYDYRTNVHHTLKQKPLTHAHLEDFVACYRPGNRHAREQTWSEETPDGRWRAWSCEELLLRDKASLDLFWLKDASMTDLENLPEPEVLADEIVENLRSALASFEGVIGH